VYRPFVANLYNMTAPENSLENCPDSLTPDHLHRFRSEGYLAFANVLSPNELRDARDALSDLTHRLTQANGDDVTFVTGKSNAAGIHSGAVFRFKANSCFMQLEPGFDPTGSSFEQLELHVRKYMNFVCEAADLRRLVEAREGIRRIVEGLIGPNAILFQEMALVKPPFVGSEKPWHQDNAYFSVAPLDSIVGVWIALDDAGVENGCMHVIPGGHTIGPLQHFHGRDCEIIEGKLDTSKAVPVPIPAGGAMFFYGLLPHETPPNRSAQRRRALQFHYRSEKSRIVDEATYNKVFADAQGIPASCKAASERLAATAK
jgi:phytanoyl-CoA hydroxylase